MVICIKCVIDDSLIVLKGDSITKKFKAVLKIVTGVPIGKAEFCSIQCT